MALHGSIEINGDQLGVWQARRLTKLRGTDAVHDYEWRVIARQGFDRTGVLSHRYSDGAVKLAALVLAAAVADD